MDEKLDISILDSGGFLIKNSRRVPVNWWIA